jgi:SnoaL-like domain
MAPTYTDVSEGVRAAIGTYAHALDDGRTDDVVALFCDDGSCDIPGLGAAQGHDALHTAYAKVEPKVPQRHLVLNTVVTEWSATMAEAVSDFVFLVKSDAGWTVLLVGRYQDRLRFDDGRWRFHHRAATFVT